jgi:hypothetical protein
MLLQRNRRCFVAAAVTVLACAAAAVLFAARRPAAPDRAGSECVVRVDASRPSGAEPVVLVDAAIGTGDASPVDERPTIPEAVLEERAVRAIDATRVHDQSGLVSLLTIGPDAVPFAARAVVGEPYAGDKTLDEYVQELAEYEPAPECPAAEVLYAAGADALPALSRAAGGTQYAPPPRPEAGVAVWVNPPRDLAYRAARLACGIEQAIADGSLETRVESSVLEMRMKCIRFLSLYASSDARARSALATFVHASIQPAPLSKQFELRVRECTCQAVRGLYYGAAFGEHRALFEALAAGTPRAGPAGVAYGSAALDSLGVSVDWDAVVRAVRIASEGARWLGLRALIDVKPDRALDLITETLDGFAQREERNYAFDALARLGAPGVPLLMRVAAGGDPDDARGAVIALGVVPGPSSDAAIAGALSAAVPQVRGAACAVLLFRRDPSRRNALEGLLADQDVRVGIAALGALVMLPDPAERPAPSLVDGWLPLPVELYGLLTTGSPPPGHLAERLRATEAMSLWQWPVWEGPAMTRGNQEAGDLLGALGEHLGATKKNGCNPYGVILDLRSGRLGEPARKHVDTARLSTSGRGALWMLEFCERLLQSGNVELLPHALVQLSSDYAFIRQRAAGILTGIANTDMGYRYDAPVPERQVATRRWWVWWARRRATAGEPGADTPGTGDVF